MATPKGSDQTHSGAATIRSEDPVVPRARASLRRIWRDQSPLGALVRGAALLLALCACVCQIQLSNTSNAAALAPNNVLSPGSALAGGQFLMSANDQYVLVMQTDGNLVEYNQGRTHASWSSKTYGHPGAFVVMQTDGNLVVYTAGRGRSLWSSGTFGNPGAYLRLQTDGNVVIYSPGGRALWDTGVISGTLDGTGSGYCGLAQRGGYPLSNAGGAYAELNNVYACGRFPSSVTTTPDRPSRCFGRRPISVVFSAPSWRCGTST